MPAIVDSAPASPALTPTNASAAEQLVPPAVPDYELLRRIGQGSYGEVWLVRNVMGEYRAVKIVHRAAFGGDSRPFEREFEGIRKFEPISRSHESQLPILHIGLNEAAGCFYYVMELADAAEEAGEKVGKWESEKDAEASRTGRAPINPDTYAPKTLRSLLSPAHFPTRSPASASTGSPAPETRLPLAQCLDIGLALTTALAHLHKQGLVHRDIKPSNIIFVQGRPKLADIGLVTDAGDARSIVGTEGYLAPEGPGSPQADLYSLGKVLYEISTGRDRRHFPDLPLDLAPESARALPLPATLAHRMGEGLGVRATGVERGEVRADHDSKPGTDQSLLTSAATGFLELNEILLRACAPGPRQRYASADAMHAELALLQSGQSVKRNRAWEQRWAIGRKVRLVSAVFVVLTVLGWRLLHDFELSRRGKQAAQRADLPPMAGTTNLEAWKLYERGKVCFRQFTVEGEKMARAHLTEAVLLDPNFLLAQNLIFAGYVNSWALSDQEAIAGMRAMAKKLREVNPNAAEAHYAQGYVVFYLDLKFAEAEKGFESAEQINPTAIGRTLYGCYLVFMGRQEAAREQLRGAVDMDPGFPIADQLLGCSYYAERNYEQALVHYQKALELAPGFLYLHWLMGGTYEAAGDYLRALDHFENVELGRGRPADELKLKYESLRQAVNQSGASGYWRVRLERAQQRSNPEDQSYEMASILAQLGRQTEALDWLEKAYAKRDSMDRLLFDHYWDILRDEARFQALLKKVGFVK